MDIKELVRSLSDPHSENMKAWTGGLGQLESKFCSFSKFASPSLGPSRFPRLKWHTVPGGSLRTSEDSYGW